MAVRAVSALGSGMPELLLRRLAAFALDTLILALLWIFAILVQASAPEDADPRRIFAGAACLLAGFLYQWVFVWALGNTIGMRIVGLRIVSGSSRDLTTMPPASAPIGSFPAIFRAAYVAMVHLAVILIGVLGVSVLLATADHVYRVGSIWPLAVFSIAGLDLAAGCLHPDFRLPHERLLNIKLIRTGLTVASPAPKRRVLILNIVAISLTLSAGSGLFLIGAMKTQRTFRCSGYMEWTTQAISLVQELAPGQAQGKTYLTQNCLNWPSPTSASANVNFEFQTSDPKANCVTMADEFYRRFGTNALTQARDNPPTAAIICADQIETAITDDPPILSIIGYETTKTGHATITIKVTSE